MAGAAPGGGGGGGGEGADKNAYYILWVIALVGAVAAIIWYFFKEQLKLFFLWVRTGELFLIDSILSIIPDNIPYVGDAIQTAQIDIASTYQAMKTITPAMLTADIADTLSTAVGVYLRYPIVALLVLFTIITFRGNVQARFKRKFNMRTLAATEQINYPQISVVTKLDLLEQDLDSGPWAMALTPMQFCKRNKLISVGLSEKASSGTSIGKSAGPEYKVTLDKVRTQRAFSVQLGRTWQGIEAMAPHRRAIFGILVARGSRDTKAATAMVGQLAASAAEGRINFEGADELWKKQMKNRRVQDMMENHAYEFTIFISALLFAREDGVLASSDFLWVKPLDRRLWYVINNVGRQTIGAEVGAVFCHWYYEMSLKRALFVPKVDAAVDAVELALSEILYIPDDKEKDEIHKRHQENLSAGIKTESSDEAVKDSHSGAAGSGTATGTNATTLTDTENSGQSNPPTSTG